MHRNRRPLSELPEDPRFRGRFLGVADGGEPFDVEVSSHGRRLGSGALVKRHVQAAARGRPLLPGDMYEEVRTAVVFGPGRRRLAALELSPQGVWRHGRHAARSLRAAVASVLAEAFPAPPPSPGP